MFDYRLLEALAAVVEERGFERAGEVLHITQPAVTQRIRQLEEFSGQVLLIRSQPPELTEAGRHILEHFRKVRILEREFSLRSGFGKASEKPLITLAVNADSLATWFSGVLRRYFSFTGGYLDIRSADQDVTHRLMVDGVAMGCISSSSSSFRGCRKEFLGNMAYRLVSTGEFARSYFPGGVDEISFSGAPKMNFNRDDQLIANWTAGVFGRAAAFHNSHFVPSSELFPVLIRNGSVCGMLPDAQFREYEDAYDLVDLSMERPVSVPLYWHRWGIDSTELDIITRIIREESRKALAD